MARHFLVQQPSQFPQRPESLLAAVWGQEVKNLGQSAVVSTRAVQSAGLCLRAWEFEWLFSVPQGWRSWLRHCATSRKVAGSIPDGVTGIFYWHNPSGRTMALGMTQPLREVSTRNISWGEGGKGGRCVGLTTLPPSCADYLQIWEPEPPGTLRTSAGL
jgi:hypothetical protein